MKNIATLNPYQSERYREFIAEYYADRESGYHEDDPNDARGPHSVEWFPCLVLGMVAVCDAEGNTLTLLYPSPRPVNHDPMFQPADGVDRSARKMAAATCNGAAGFLVFRDDFAHAVEMDAPYEMPAGSTAYFAYDVDVYGAYSTSFYRE